MYDPSVFARGQRYRAEVIRILATKRIIFSDLPAHIDAGEVVRRCFYQPVSAEYCADAIMGAIGL